MEATDICRNPPLEARYDEPFPLPLLLTKLHRPRANSGLEQRLRLLEYLDDSAPKTLTLISAPAGYGKTTLASTWLQASDRRSAWVSLDERDDDLVIFTAYLLAAVNGAFPNLELKTQSLLRSPLAHSASTLARYLTNDLDRITEPFVLVLDGIHQVRQQAIFDLLGQLLRHPPPTMRLVLIGRRDPPLPIAFLRARGQLIEIRARDLAFTAPETARLLSRLLDRDIPKDIAVEWTQMTEGWVTCLRLAALSLLQSGQTDNLRVVIPGSPQHLQDYLLAEVLERLPPVKREWLLRASLFDRFCAPLCEAACRSDADADADEGGLAGTAFIRWLVDANLFLVALDNQGEWYRLNHLFRSLLRIRVQAQLGPAEIASLRLRASAWCAENGLRGEAVEYALASGDAEAAMQMLVRYRYDLMNAGQWLFLERWLKQLPAHIVTESPLFLTTQALLTLHRSDPQGALALCQQAALLLAGLSPESAEHQVAQAELAALQPLRDFLRGQFAAAIASTRASRDALPPQALYVRAVATSHIAFGLLASGDSQGCIRTCREALADPGWPVGARAVLLSNFCVFQFMLGDLIGVLETAGECVRFARKFDLPDLMNLGRYHLGSAHYLRNEWLLAQPHLLALLDDAPLVDPTYLAFGAFVLALIHQGQGREADAEEVIARLGAHLLEIEHRPAQFLMATFRDALALHRGDVAEARRLVGYPSLVLGQPYWYATEVARPKLPSAERTPEGLVEARRGPYLSKVLAAFPAPAQAGERPGPVPAAAEGSARSPWLAEPLTERELTILALLTTDLSPEEMAGELSVSVATVRTHIRNIYSKLDVRNRFQAVQAAAKLGLQ